MNNINMKNVHNCSKQDVYHYNLDIHKKKLVFQNFGNVSGRNEEHCFIKPSGLVANQITLSSIVSVSLKNLEYYNKNNFKPSSDTPTHVSLYNYFDEIGGIVHTHSIYATAWCQAGRAIPCFGTTHADYWAGEIPVTRKLSNEEIETNYEDNIGKVIIEKLESENISPFDCPGILVHGHGPFSWGKNISDAVKHAELLEFISKEAYLSITLNKDIKPISKMLKEKHFFRKHGSEAYYGQEIE